MATIAAHTVPRRISLPHTRGLLTERLFATLQEPPGTPIARHPGELPDEVCDPLADEDLQLALYVANELHYSGIDGVDPDWEWDASLRTFLTPLERCFEGAVRELVGEHEPVAPDQVGAALQAIVAADDSPPLARWVETQASEEQLEEFLIHRSAYQLKEADPHSWALPRLSGAPKAALVEVQGDEYGGGRADRIHAELFAKAMAAVGLDARYGAHIDRWPALTLATVNLMTLLGLQRRLRGAIVGHLAAFEMTSSLPNRRYGNALRRLGHGPDATDFFDEHVEADAVHENIAAWDLAGGLATAEPELTQDILFGARALLAVEGRWAGHLLDAWQRAETSLLPAR